VVLTLAASAGRVCYHDGEKIVRLDLKSGRQQRAADRRGPKNARHSGGTLVMHGDALQRNAQLTGELRQAKGQIRTLQDKLFGRKSEQPARADRSHDLFDPSESSAP